MLEFGTKQFFEAKTAAADILEQEELHLEFNRFEGLDSFVDHVIGDLLKNLDKNENFPNVLIVVHKVVNESSA